MAVTRLARPAAVPAGAVEQRHRWLIGAGLVVIALVIAASAGGGVGLGATARPLALTVAVAVYAAAAAVYLLWLDAPTPVAVALLLWVAAAACGIHAADPGGPVIGLYLVLAFAPLRVDGRTAAVVSVVAVAGFEAVIAATAPSPAVYMVAVAGGAGFFYFFGSLLRREQEQRERADGLVVELRASREAEKAAAAEAERARLAREMHDVLAHTLTGLVTQLQGAGMLVRARGADPELMEVLNRAAKLAQGGLAEARTAVLTLRGHGQAPGPAAIADLVEEHRKLPDAGSYDYAETGQRQPLAPQVALALYRTAQEALANIGKHAPGADVGVCLSWQPTGVELSVHNGPAPRRSPLAAAGTGYGLAGMRERAELLGGQLRAGHAEGGGFSLCLRLPISVREIA